MKKLILAALVLAACAKTDTAAIDSAAADTVATSSTPTPASVFAGTWNGRSKRLPTDTGTVWTMVFTAGADGNLTGTLRFPSQNEDIPMRVTEATMESVKSEFGPYTSPTIGGARGTSRTDGTLAGDSLSGTFVFTPEGGGAPVNGTFVAKRATP